MKTKKIVMSLSGVIITAFSIGAFKFAAFGVDPFQSFMSGIDALVPIGFGTLYIVVNAILLLFAWAFDRHYIGIATFINLFLLGYIVDFSQTFITRLLPDPDIAVRMLFFILGFVFLCFGSSLYMAADMGVSTYDAIALICTNKWKLGKFRTIRIATDFLCIASGIGMYLLAGNTTAGISSFVGIGTILTAFCMGPLIDIFNQFIASSLLRKNQTEAYRWSQRNLSGVNKTGTSKS